MAEGARGGEGVRKNYRPVNVWGRRPRRPSTDAMHGHSTDTAPPPSTFRPRIGRFRVSRQLVGAARHGTAREGRTSNELHRTPVV